jgi:hypothetical protein
VFLFWPPPILLVCQISRQRQRWKGWSLWRGGKGSSFLAHSRKQITLLWETARETKSLRPLCRNQEFYYATDSGEINSQSPEPWSVSGDVLYTPQVVYVTRGVLQYMVYRWSERQVSYRETSWLQSFPPTPLQNVVTVTRNLAEPSWRSVTLLSLQKAACGPRIGNSKQILDTQ